VIGSGKVQEGAATCAATAADVVIFANDLTGRQRAILTKRIGVGVHAAGSLGLV
jgi:50S ribosomal subunit-associated GTPase HflX